MLRTAVLALVLLAPLALAMHPLAHEHRAEHDLAMPDGATIRVIEKWSGHGSGEAILFIPATLVTHVQWDSSVSPQDSYSGLDLAAARGYRAYVMDHEGYGGSSKPADGRDVTFEKMLAQYQTIVAWISARTGDEDVDVVGASLGSSLAFALSSDLAPASKDLVGKVVLTSHVYKEPSPFAQSVFLGPGACDNFRSQPDGYIDTQFPMLAPIVFNAEPPALLWMSQAFPGRYAVGPTLEGCDLPVVEAEVGRAPALVFMGDRDLMSASADMDLFCAEYGGACHVAFVPGMGHAPNFEPKRHELWAQAFAFLEP